jgi:hypothetical protein
MDEREQKDVAIRQREKELKQSDKVRVYIRQFAQLIADQDTGKRKFRYGPYCSAFGFSGKRISKALSVEEIVELITPSFKLREIGNLLKHIGVTDNELVNELATYAKEYVGWGKPYTVVGEPIADLTLEAFYKDRN